MLNICYIIWFYYFFAIFVKTKKNNMVDLINISIIVMIIGYALIKLFSSCFDGKKTSDQIHKENMTDVDPVTGDYTSKYDGSRRTKDGCLIHW